jgi:acetyl-CoA acetyltransferase
MAGNFLRDKDIVIIAYGEIKNELRSGKTAPELASEAMEEVFRWSGLTNRDIDGLAINLPAAEVGNSFYSNILADNLGIEARWLQLTDIGGCAVLGNVARAAAALKCGMCEIALCLNSDASSRRQQTSVLNYRTEFQDPTGYQGPLIAFGLMTDAYRQKYNFKQEALGKLALAQRAGALANDNAVANLRKPMTMDDYLNSRMVSDPIRLLDCVMRCDGANAVIVTTLDRAKALGAKKMVRLAASSDISNYDPTNALPDPFESGFSVVGPDALKKAGMSPSDVDMFHPYDDFLIAMLFQLEQIGFCKRGEGSEFLLTTDLSPKGKLPINTSGGNLAECYMHGLELINEAVRQVRGTSTCQVKDVQISLVASGPMVSPVSSLILHA